MSPKADDPRMIEALQRFIDASANDAGFEPPFTEADRDLILSLTGVAAHTVVRPAGPFASMVVGYLVGSGKAESWADAHDQVKRFVRAYIGDPVEGDK
ncbi:hypothetical protein HMPREF3157_03495 [Dermabacter sp. HMSC06F07]|uniref:DUF6457 domain-containing protein n=1 Tax=Dermabacter TaxID=36739 RepID=UPI0008A24394|nr:DUF6457 domain-containing protein [Dermabacter sp. HMSC06F07]MCT1708926.1 DUF6457 domain-containing protein [Dermabacter hominis]OFT47398.1 hypothetical protein HMPREF3157_03495 [Dermabacter sp. HMSC06F07]